jgi:hypothetical protein
MSQDQFDPADETADVVVGSTALTESGFSRPLVTITNEADGMALATVAQNKFELESIMEMSARMPRDELARHGAIIASAKRPELAAAAQYRFKRGGSTVTGISVKGARPIRTLWQYMISGYRILRMEPKGAYIEGFCHDVQNGVIERVPGYVRFMQQRKRDFGDGERTEWEEVTDERDRRELLAKGGAIVERNAILGVIPPDVLEDFKKACNATNAAVASKELGANRKQTIASLIAAYGELGVVPEMLAQKIGNVIDEITPEQLAELRVIYRSITGEGRPVSEFFERPKPKVKVGLDLSKAKTREGQDPPGGAPLRADQTSTPTPSEPEKPKAGDGKLPLGGSATDAR